MELKAGYKQAEVGVIPEDWDVRRLGDIATVTSGGTPSRDVPSYWNGTIPWVTTSQIDFEGINNAAQFITELGLKNSAAKKLPVGTLLMAMYGQGKTRGKVGVLAIEATTNQACAAIVLDDTDIYPTYIFHYLISRYDTVRNLSNSGSQENLNALIIRSIQILLPPLPEQRAIAAALSDMDALLTGLDALIAKKRDLKQAAMQQLLTGKQRLPGFSGAWEVRQFGDMFRFLNTANNPRSDLVEHGDIGYIHYGDIHTGTSSFLDCSSVAFPYIAQELVASIPALEDGDMIMVDASEDYEGIGKCVEVKNVGRRRVVAGLHTLLLRGDKSRVADGFKGYLQYLPAVKESLMRLATGISVYGISKNSVKSVEVSLPCTDEQAAIAAVLSDMDAELAALATRRDKTRALKQGMMQELLTGRIRLL